MITASLHEVLTPVNGGPNAVSGFEFFVSPSVAYYPDMLDAHLRDVDDEGRSLDFTHHMVGLCAGNAQRAHNFRIYGDFGTEGSEQAGDAMALFGKRMQAMACMLNITVDFEWVDEKPDDV